MTPSLDLDPRTPVLVGVGQVAERVDDADYRALSPVQLAVEAARAAFADTGIDPDHVAAALDTLAAIRQFEISTPLASAPFGRSTNVARSIAAGAGADPRRAILEVVGGQAPQHLVGELGDDIAAGRSEVAVVVGSEAISTARHLADADPRPDWSETPEGDVEDRGYGLTGVATMEQVRHGLIEPSVQYAMLEHARRSRLGLDRAAYAAAMGELFAPFTRVAAANPLSAAPEERDATTLSTPTERNRMVADPYPRFLVSRDQVNQGAALVLMSVGAARRLGVPEDRWVFLHGRADLVEKTILDRPDLGAYPAAVHAVELALEVAGIGLDRVDAIDLYSCFPIAVASVCDGLGLAHDDPRGLTLTGGLPFFGGPGNNYSTHAIAEAVARCRTAPGSFALVGANGGLQSKYSAGVYATTPRSWPADPSGDGQADLDAVAPAAVTSTPDGWATIETYTVTHGRSGPRGAMVVGRLERSGERFLANPVDGDDEVMSLLTGDVEPLGTRVFVRSFGYGNRVTLTRDRADELVPRAALGLRESYEHVLVRRDGHVLEVTLNRPDQRNALHADAHVELEQVFDSFEADPDLWVAIITGAGDRAFCSGNDLAVTATGGLPWFPHSGFAGLTSRALTKPVIAAVNGVAMGGGFEIVLACQLAVADETASFALPEVKVGLFAAAGGVVRLPRAISSKMAHDLVLTGRRIGAQEALDLGIVSRVAPAGGALEAARALAAEVIAVSPTSVRLSLQVMGETRGIADEVEAVRHETDAMIQLVVSEDTLEGVMAFVEKRTPVWKNR